MGQACLLVPDKIKEIKYMNDISLSEKEKKRIDDLLFKIRTGEIDLNKVERIELWDEKELEGDEVGVNIRKVINHFLTQQLKGNDLPIKSIKPVLRKWLNKEREKLGFDIIVDGAKA